MKEGRQEGRREGNKDGGRREVTLRRSKTVTWQGGKN